MLLLTHTEPEFTRLIQERTPRIAQMPFVQDLMKKYTSGYLTKKRLAAAISVGTLPMVTLEAVSGGASGSQSGDNIAIDTAYFTGFKEGHPNTVKIVSVTVFHELAHWGYWKGQQEGHPSDAYGREHNNHGEYMSPLNGQMYKLFDALMVIRLLF